MWDSVFARLSPPAAPVVRAPGRSGDRQAAESGIMRDHQNRVTLVVQFAQKLDHGFLICFI